MNIKYGENIGLLDMLLKTDQFNSLKDEIIKDSLKTILSCFKYHNDKINQIDAYLYNKISREEFNQNLKNKVNYSDFMSQINEIGEKNKQSQNKKIYLSNLDYYNYNEKLPSENKLDNFNKEIQNLKLEYSMLSKKIDNIMIFHQNNSSNNSLNKKENINFEIKNKIEKNEKDIINLNNNFQNKIIKIEDDILNLKMNQINKNELNKNINDGLKKIEENNIKNIENEMKIVKNKIDKQISDTIIEINKNNIKDDNINNNKNIKIDLFLKEIFAKFDIFDEMLKDMNSKFHKKSDKEEIIDIYSNIEEINNNLINHKNEIETKLNKIKKDFEIQNKKNNIYGIDINSNYYDNEIKNIKLNIKENYNLINNLKEELNNLKKEKKIFAENINEKELNLSNHLENNYNFYPKNDMKNEFSYLKRFINTFMLEIKNDNKKVHDMLLNSLNEKINIIDINKVLNEINNEMNNKVNLDLYNQQFQTQNDINNLISKEHIIGKWASHKNTPMKNAFIIWDEQLINFDPNNYCFSPNNSHILIKEKGIYLIKIIIFNDYKNNNSMSNIQLVIDRKKVYNFSYSNRKLLINNEINNEINNNSFEESIIFEECIKVNEICRIEIRIDGFNYSKNDDEIILNNRQNNYMKNENINSILSIRLL